MLPLLHPRAVAAALVLLSVTGPAALAPAADAVRPGSGPPADEALEPFRGALLELAFETASAIPVRPHARNRARTQAAVVETALELEQPQRAARYAKGMGTWRRYAAHADLATWHARRGHEAAARSAMEVAGRIPADEEDWRRDRVMTGIARTLIWLGEPRLAEAMTSDVEASEAGKLADAKAAVAGAGAFDEHVEGLETLIATGQFDIRRNALDSYTTLYDRFYENPVYREQVKARIRAGWTSLPGFLRMDLLLDLADSALDHGDRSEALGLVDEARALLDGATWPREAAIRYTALIAARRHRAGDAARARSELDAALARYDAEQDRIVNIERAETLQPVAEAYRTLGDPAAAHAVYRRAIEAGVVNPNSTPRAEDLAATLCSMARSGVEPDAALMDRIRSIREALGRPW